MTKNVTNFTSPVFTNYLGVWRSRTAPVPPGSAVTSFVLRNSENSSSPGFFTGTIPFARGQMTKLLAPSIRRGGTPVAAQYDDIVLWDDGTIKSVVFSMSDTDFAANEARTYDVFVELALFDNSGTKTLTDITSNTDFEIELTNNIRHNGTTTEADPLGTTLTANFNAHSAVNTRVKRMTNTEILGNRVRSGPVMEEFEVWGDFVNGSSTAHPHLKCTWNVKIWKDGNGDIVDYEYGATVEQDWWAKADKFRQNYDATLKDGATTIQTYSGIQHHYRAWWFTADMSNVDTRHGKMNWKNTAPTLNYEPDYSYWVACDYIPPYNVSRGGVINKAVYTNIYTPLGTMSHRGSIDSGGNYMGRGIHPDSDCIAIIDSTPANNRVSRVNALAGLGVPYHYRDDTNATTTIGTDVANTIVPLILRQKPTSYYDFQTKGMPAPKDAYITTPNPALGIDLGGYIDPVGGNGGWSPSPDASHSANFCEFSYLLEGGRHMQRAIRSLAMNTCHQRLANQFGGNPPLIYGRVNSAIDANDINNIWGGIAQFYPSQTRSLGWAMVLLAAAMKTNPHNSIESEWMTAWINHNFDYVSASIDQLPADMIAAGLYSYEALSTPWQQGFVAAGAACLYQHSRDSRIKKLLDMCGTYFTNVASRGGRAFQTFNHIQQPIIGLAGALDLGAPRFQDGVLEDATPYTAGPVFAAGQFFTHLLDATVQNDVLSLDTSLGKYYNTPLNAGAEVIFYNKSTNQATLKAKPSQINWGQIYHLVDDGGQIKVSETAGGSPMTLDNIATGGASIAIRDTSFSNYTTAQATVNGGLDNNYLPGPIFEAPQIKAHLIFMNKLDSSILSDTNRDKAITYCSNVEYNNATFPGSSFYCWDFAVPS